MSVAPTCVALIPSRAGSKRVEGKNIKRLAGHPLIAYTIQAALESGVFESVVVSTDDEEHAAIARHYGAETPFMRPMEMAGDHSPDIEWTRHALGELERRNTCCDAFSILRPTNPFRQAGTIVRAWQQFLSSPGVDSIRAVELCSQHPGKMWVIKGALMAPVLPVQSGTTPWHSMPYQALPKVYVQNASLEIAWSRVVSELGSISGDAVAPFLTTGFEGFDINSLSDWHEAEKLISEGRASLPQINVRAYK